MIHSAGLAAHSLAMDDSPHARGAVDMAERLRRSRAMDELAERDADLIGTEVPTDAVDAVAARRAETRAAAISDKAIADHAVLAITNAYRSRDTRAVIFRADGRVEVVR